MLELTALLVLGNGSVSNWDVQKQAYFSILDSLVGEMTASFWGSNLALLEVVGSLFAILSKAFMQPADVKPLADPLQLHSETLEAELNVGAAFLQKKLPSHSTLETVIKEMMLQFKDAFPDMYSLYAAAFTIGVSTATCEYSFSTVTRILQPRRRSMTHEQKAHEAGASGRRKESDPPLRLV